MNKPRFKPLLVILRILLFKSRLQRIHSKILQILITMETIHDILWFLNLSRDKITMCLGAGPCNSPSQSKIRLISRTVQSLNPHLLIKFFIMHG
uniref:Uncharacterized protein n=1 Tax=Cannabis sativa TaxID=3483 RepID=A0A803QWF8_CANSA